jgi:hypothetical protein
MKNLISKLNLLKYPSSPFFFNDHRRNKMKVMRVMGEQKNQKNDLTEKTKKN